MLAVVYVEGVLITLLTLGYLLLAAIGISTSNAPVWYSVAFAAGGTYSLASLWWVLVTAILLLQKNRRYAVPLLIKVGIGTGFAFSSLLVLYPWLIENTGYVENRFPFGLIFLVSIPCAIALHLLSLLSQQGD